MNLANRFHGIGTLSILSSIWAGTRIRTLKQHLAYVQKEGEALSERKIMGRAIGLHSAAQPQSLSPVRFGGSW